MGVGAQKSRDQINHMQTYSQVGPPGAVQNQYQNRSMKGTVE